MQVTGEVKRIVADEAILDDEGKVVLERFKPIIYDEEQLRYLEVGASVSRAFKRGAETKASFARKLLCLLLYR